MYCTQVGTYFTRCAICVGPLLTSSAMDFIREQLTAAARMAGLGEVKGASEADLAHASHLWQFLDEIAQRDPKE